MSDSDIQNNNTQRVAWNRIREILWGTPDRKLAAFQTVVSLISVVASLFLFKLPEKIPVFVVIRDIALASIFLLAAAFWFYRYVTRRAHLDILNEQLAEANRKIESIKREQQRQVSTLIQRSHRMIHDFRDIQFRGFRTSDPSDLMVDIDEVELDIFKDICDSVTRQTRDALLSYFRFQGFDLGEDLCVTVKLIVPASHIISFYKNRITAEQEHLINSKSRWVVTVYRDPATWARVNKQREAGQRVYDIDRNTAFIRIVSDNADCFSSNDLKALNDTYLNETPKWEDWYNSTMVVPIRFANSEEEQEQDSKHYHVFGLLAADSMNKNNFALFDRNNDSFQLLAQASDLLANYFLTLSLYQYYELYEDMGEDE